MSPQDITNILIGLIGIVFYVYKALVEPRLPTQKAIQINNDLATLTQVTTLVVQKIEQQYTNLSPVQRKSQAVEDIKLLLQEVGAPVPSVEAISGAIESAVYLLGLAQGKQISDKVTRQQRL